MLSLIDDGLGMNHDEVMKMVSFGHKQSDQVDKDHIGKFGVGFKVVFSLIFSFLSALGFMYELCNLYIWSFMTEVWINGFFLSCLRLTNGLLGRDWINLFYL